MKAWSPRRSPRARLSRRSNSAWRKAATSASPSPSMIPWSAKYLSPLAGFCANSLNPDSMTCLCCFTFSNLVGSSPSPNIDAIEADAFRLSRLLLDSAVAAVSSAY